MRNITHVNIDDLYNLCLKEGVIHFSAKDENSIIYLHTKGKFVSYATESLDNEGRIPITLLACHCGENANKTYISRETMEQALPSFQLRPILANIIQKPDGTWDFGSHDMELVDSPFEGEETRVNYIERQVGTIYGEVKLVYDEEAQVDRVLAEGFLEADYGNGAAEILAERGNTEVSVELALHEFTFNKEKGILDIIKFRFAGVTLLGADKEAGMVGSIAYLSNYDNYEKSDVLDKEKGGMHMEDTNITIEENANDEIILNENNEENSEKDLTENENVEFEESEEVVENEEVDNQEENEQFENEIDETVETGMYTIQYELSFDDIRCDIYRKLSSEEIDAYIIDVFENYFYYETYSEEGTAYFRQDYFIEDEKVNWDVDPIRVFPMFLTETEKQEIEAMREEYPTLVEYRDNNEKHIASEQKNAIINDEYYNSIRETEAFKNIVTNIDNYSVEELQVEVDRVYVNESKKTFNYSAIGHNTSVKVNTFHATNNDPYGDLFEE